MGEQVLVRGRHLSESASIAIVGDEHRVVAEAAMTAPFGGDGALHHPFGDHFPAVGQAATPPSGTWPAETPRRQLSAGSARPLACLGGLVPA